MKADSLTRYLDQRLKDKRFRAVYDGTEAQYQLTRSIIAERIKQNLSQNDLAKKAETTQTVISRIENMTFNPTLELINRVTTALGKKLTISLR